MRNVSYQALHRQWIRNFHDTLTEVVSKLVDHHVGSQGKHEVNQAVKERLLVRRGRHTSDFDVGNHVLQFPAAGLVEAIEV
jgi:hypothetical protein